MSCPSRDTRECLKQHYNTVKLRTAEILSNWPTDESFSTICNPQEKEAPYLSMPQKKTDLV